MTSIVRSIANSVGRHLYNEMSMNYNVKLSCVTQEAPDDPVETQISVVAMDAEEAKSIAVSQAMRMNYSHCDVMSVQLVPDSDPMQHDLGSGMSVHTDNLREVKMSEALTEMEMKRSMTGYMGFSMVDGEEWEIGVEMDEDGEWIVAGNKTGDPDLILGMKAPSKDAAMKIAKSVPDKTTKSALKRMGFKNISWGF